MSLRDWISEARSQPLTPERVDYLMEKAKQQGYTPRPRPRCACGHPLDEHDETGRCVPMVMIDASQGMGVLVQGRCSHDCHDPRTARNG